MAALRSQTKTSPAPGTSSRNLGIVAAVLGVLLCWVLVAPQQYAADDLTGERLPYAPDSWFDGHQGVYDALGDPLGMSAYYFWGHFAFLFYVAGIVAARALPQGTCRRSRIGRRLLLVGFVAGLVGDVVGYWGGMDEVTTLTDIGFLAIEVPAMLLTVVSLVVYGLGLAHDGARRTGWILVAGAVLTVPFNVLVIGYVPHGILLPVIATIGVALAAARTDG